jgi:quercetin dioxygenase-like cupin family protein
MPRFGSTRLPALALLTALSTLALAQSSAPTDNKGTSTQALGSIELASEAEGTNGRQLRARSVTIEPGGHTAVHSHKGRPTLEYVLQGHVIEIRNGVEVPHAPGDVVKGTGDVTHWWENRGTTTVILVPFDVYTP